MKLQKAILLVTLLLTFTGYNIIAQISPGDLSKAHAELEGVSNCTKCHSAGKKVLNQKCLDCHKEIKANILSKKGYHASAEVKGKDCATCHNEHHGRNFQITRFDKNNFNHAKTGFTLKGQHAKEDCKACHKPAYIKDAKLRKNQGTYLGLDQSCLSCHDDYHQGKMSSNCTDCHSFNSFKNAKAFDHNKTRFPLLGEHINLSCAECHKTEIVNGKPAQKYTGMAFGNCNACHKDAHNNRFGQNCKQCHSEVSFHTIKRINTFDHDKTRFKLVGKHKLVDCKECHKTNLTDPLKHERCTDCHTDYHKKQFAKNNITPDCNECHSVYGFNPSEYTIDRHNQTKFKLEGAHAATSCTECHKKQKDWSFRNIGNQCIDCHENEHKGFISAKFLPNDDCTVCHSVNSWTNVSFDHDKTKFKLEGAHVQQTCAACHYRKDENGIKKQQFEGIPVECSSCHKDEHAGQFAINGKTDCAKCHESDKWENSKFDHNTSRFKIDGEHVGVKCEECHKPVINEKGSYIEYKFDNIDCAKCHS